MDYLAVFLVGLLGGVHCVGMCGGIVSALSFSSAAHLTLWQQLPMLFAYNIGRISSYMLAGALVAGISSQLLDLTTLAHIEHGLQIFAAIVMILLGLYLAGFWKILVHLEHLGRTLWRYLEPFGRRFIPVRHWWQALPLGMIWGWLPCGMVYTALFTTLTAGSASQGALLMLAFGLGTLPNLLAMGLFANKLRSLTQQAYIKQAAGLLIILFGGIMLWQSLQILASPQ
ncbi:MAG TPA: sulfite exporter TauE/SafE family protein [Thiothrix sp.]|nr:sulfite exporter TauE/SafE family protein [Thiothrix sp.]